VLALLAASTSARADDSTEPPSAVVSTVPLPRTSYLRLEPSYTFMADGGHESELHMRVFVTDRGDEPGNHSREMVWSIAFDLDVDREVTPTMHAAGLDDLEITPLWGIRTKWGLVGGGLAISVPTATDRALGSGVARVGPAWFLQSSVVPHLVLSMLMRCYFATAAADDGSAALLTKIEPGIAVKLPDRFLLSSTSKIEVNWLASRARFPLDLQVGHQFGRRAVISLGSEVDVAGRERGDVKLELMLDYVGL
jgi:hypothetical protein